MEQKFFALTSAARRVAFECDFDLSFAAARDKSPRPRPLSWKRGRSERQCGKAQVFLQLRLALAFPFPLHKCLGRQRERARAGSEQLHQSPLGAHLSPIIGFLPATFPPPLPSSLSLFAATWRRAQAHFEVYEAAL